MNKRIVAAAMALSLAAPALAGVTGVVGVVEDPYGARAVAKGHIAKVDQRLSTAFAQGDHSPEVLINLAAIRLQQQDHAGARELYRMVLAQPNVDMATLRGAAWSHEIAKRGLASETIAANW